MIYLTGDIHLTNDIHKIVISEELHKLTPNDILIILGDCGLTWDNSERTKSVVRYLDTMPYQTLCLAGNHENFDLLYQIPKSDYLGGKVRRLSPKVAYLENGEVFTIEGKKFFVMGGASSIDKVSRVPGLSWWPEEVPTIQQRKNARRNLAEHRNTVDFVLTHCAPVSVARDIASFCRFNNFFRDEVEEYLENMILGHVDFSSWHFGHYHIDYHCRDGRFWCYYNDIVRLV